MADPRALAPSIPEGEEKFPHLELVSHLCNSKWLARSRITKTNAHDRDPNWRITETNFVHHKHSLVATLGRGIIEASQWRCVTTRPRLQRCALPGGVATGSSTACDKAVSTGAIPGFIGNGNVVGKTLAGLSCLDRFTIRPASPAQGAIEKFFNWESSWIFFPHSFSPHCLP